MKSTLFLLVFAFSLSGCAKYDSPTELSIGDKMVTAQGETLDGSAVTIPDNFAGNKTLLLLGYVHKSQFDIDRWLIGLDVTDTKVDVYEVATLKGMFPEAFSTAIDNAMREGTPKDLWKGVVTVYEDADLVQSFTGNLEPIKARVMLLDETGHVVYFYDQGFSVSALNALRAAL